MIEREEVALLLGLAFDQAETEKIESALDARHEKLRKELDEATIKFERLAAIDALRSFEEDTIPKIKDYLSNLQSGAVEVSEVDTTPKQGTQDVAPEDVLPSPDKKEDVSVSKGKETPEPKAEGEPKKDQDPAARAFSNWFPAAEGSEEKKVEEVVTQKESDEKTPAKKAVKQAAKKAVKKPAKQVPKTATEAPKQDKIEPSSGKEEAGLEIETKSPDKNAAKPDQANVAKSVKMPPPLNIKKRVTTRKSVDQGDLAKPTERITLRYTSEDGDEVRLHVISADTVCFGRNSDECDVPLLASSPENPQAVDAEISLGISRRQFYLEKTDFAVFLCDGSEDKEKGQLPSTNGVFLSRRRVFKEPLSLETSPRLSFSIEDEEAGLPSFDIIVVPRSDEDKSIGAVLFKRCDHIKEHVLCLWSEFPLKLLPEFSGDDTAVIARVENGFWIQHDGRWHDIIEPPKPFGVSSKDRLDFSLVAE